MANRDTILYQIAVAVLVLMTTVSMIAPFFTGSYARLGYPAHLMYILPIYKILGLTAILSNKSDRLSEWAYAGFILLFILAIYSHVMVADNVWPVPAIPLVALAYMYYYKHKLKVHTTSAIV